MLKQLLGHDGEPQLHRTNLVTGEALGLCPVRAVDRARAADPALGRELDLVYYQLYPPYRDHGVLPVAGGALDQPARLMDYLTTLAANERLVDAKLDEIRRKNDALAGEAGA